MLAGDEITDPGSKLSELCEDQAFTDLKETCREVLWHIESALNNTEPANMLCSLKHAREIAMKVTEQ